MPAHDGSAPEPEPDPLPAEQNPPAQPLPCGCLTVLLCACVLEWVVDYVEEADGRDDITSNSPGGVRADLIAMSSTALNCWIKPKAQQGFGRLHSCTHMQT